jgi:DNA modification methylase
MSMPDWKNKLFFGDNLGILRDHIPDESVDLVYIDPPFNSKASYNVLYKEHNGTPSQAQATAFEDSWHWTAEVAAYFVTMKNEMPVAVHDMLEAMYGLLKGSDMMAYIVMMTPRLVELYRVLKPTGSIYVHCDPTASHYLKILMDSIFGPEVFRNEIVWKRTSSHNDSKKWAHVHDVLLYYTKTPEFTWNPIYTGYDKQYLNAFYRFEDSRGSYRLDHIIRSRTMGPRPNLAYEYKGYTPQWGWRVVREKLAAIDQDGRLFWSDTGRPYLKRYLAEQKGALVSSIWTDIPPIGAQATERLGYQTQKPRTLLDRIIKASSNEGDLILDAFCGCGTTVEAAEALHRRWIGIDITYLAIDIMKDRLARAFGDRISPYEVYGVPVDFKSAESLFHKNPFEFQFWACRLIGATPLDHRKDKPMEAKHGSDAGIDGILYFNDDDSGKSKRAIVSVKGGGVEAKDVRDLNGAVTRENAQVGVLLTLEDPTSAMVKEAISDGFYKPPVETRAGKVYPKIQIITIEEALKGKTVDVPGKDDSYKRAEPISKAKKPNLFEA